MPSRKTAKKPAPESRKTARRGPALPEWETSDIIRKPQDEPEVRDVLARRWNAFYKANEQRKKDLLDIIERECLADPVYLARVLKRLQPLRPPGAAAPAWQAGMVDEIVRALTGAPVNQIVACIASNLNRSTVQAHRLYDAALKRRR